MPIGSKGSTPNLEIGVGRVSKIRLGIKDPEFKQRRVAKVNYSLYLMDILSRIGYLLHHSHDSHLSLISIGEPVIFR